MIKLSKWVKSFYSDKNIAIKNDEKIVIIANKILYFIIIFLDYL